MIKDKLLLNILPSDIQNYKKHFYLTMKCTINPSSILYSKLHKLFEDLELPNNFTFNELLYASNKIIGMNPKEYIYMYNIFNYASFIERNINLYREL